MNPAAARRARLLAVAALVLMGAASLWLSRLRTGVELGKPGVKLSSVPVLEEDTLKVARTNSVALPTRLPGYVTRSEPISRVELVTLPPDTTYARRTFAAPDRSFVTQCSAVLMGTDRTSIHRPEVCLVSQGWRIQRRASDRIPVAKPAPYALPVRRFDLEFTGRIDGRDVRRSGVYVFWFVADGHVTDSHFDRQWWMMRDLVTRRVLQRWAYVSFFSDCAPGEEDATYRRIAEVAAAAVPEFQLTGGTPP